MGELRCALPLAEEPGLKGFGRFQVFGFLRPALCDREVWVFRFSAREVVTDGFFTFFGGFGHMLTEGLLRSFWIYKATSLLWY